MNDNDRHPKDNLSQLDLSALRDAGAAILSWIAQVAASTQAILETARPHIQEFVSMMSNVQAFVDYWEKNATALLNDAIGARGLIVPASQISLDDLAELVRLYSQRGARAVTDRIALHYEEIFRRPDFLKDLTSAWTARPSLKRRLPLLLQALRGHELGMFALSVPTLLAQFEGLVVDLVGYVGTMKSGDLKKHVANIAGAGDILNTFVSDALLAKFAHGSLMPPFSRHAILHGGDVDYATETNSRTVILLIDQLTEFVKDG